MIFFSERETDCLILGASNETKPDTSASNWVFFEMDTFKVYVRANSTWIPYNPATVSSSFFYTGSMIVLSASYANTASYTNARGRLLNTLYFTSGSGTYTPSSGVTSIEFEMVGAGGGGGGVSGSTSAGSAAAGGSAGGYLKKRLTTLTGSYTYVVGNAGAGGIGNAGSGSSGQNTSLSDGTTTWIAFSGSGGAGQLAGTTFASVSGPRGGTTQNADFTIAGAQGGTGIRFSGTQVNSGEGGNSYFGYGGIYVVNAPGTNATQYGAGGSGASTIGNTNRSGGSGSAGILIINEYT